MQVLLGKASREIGRDELVRLATEAERVVLDLGTGDARYAYRLAKEEPGALVVGVDAERTNFAETAARAARKPAKGGVPNLLLVAARAEELPPELDGLADEVHAILPWGRLMRDVLLADPVALASFRRAAKPGAQLLLVLNAEIFGDPIPVDVRDLPPLTHAYVDEVMAPAYAALGVTLEPAELMGPRAIKGLRSTWARKLAHGRDPRFFRVEGRFA